MSNKVIVFTVLFSANIFSQDIIQPLSIKTTSVDKKIGSNEPPEGFVSSRWKLLKEEPILSSMHGQVFASQSLGEVVILPAVVLPDSGQLSDTVVFYRVNLNQLLTTLYGKDASFDGGLLISTDLLLDGKSLGKIDKSLAIAVHNKEKAVIPNRVGLNSYHQDTNMLVIDIPQQINKNFKAEDILNQPPTSSNVQIDIKYFKRISGEHGSETNPTVFSNTPDNRSLVIEMKNVLWVANDLGLLKKRNYKNMSPAFEFPGDFFTLEFGQDTFDSLQENVRENTRYSITTMLVGVRWFADEQLSSIFDWKESRDPLASKAVTIKILSDQDSETIALLPFLNQRLSNGHVGNVTGATTVSYDGNTSKCAINVNFFMDRIASSGNILSNGIALLAHELYGNVQDFLEKPCDSLASQQETEAMRVKREIRAFQAGVDFLNRFTNSVYFYGELERKSRPAYFEAKRAEEQGLATWESVAKSKGIKYDKK